MTTATKQVSDEPLSTEQIRLLAEIGFMGAGIGKSVEAERLFMALQTLRPDRAASYIGVAMARLNARDYEGAIRVLRDEGMKAVPDNTEIRVFLGLALRMAKRTTEAEKVLNQVTKEYASSDAPEIALAKEVLLAS